MFQIFKKTTHLTSLKMTPFGIALAALAAAPLKTHVHHVTVTGGQGMF